MALSAKEQEGFTKAIEYIFQQTNTKSREKAQLLIKEMENQIDRIAKECKGACRKMIADSVVESIFTMSEMVSREGVELRTSTTIQRQLDFKERLREIREENK